MVDFGFQSVCKHDSSKTFELIMIKLCRGAERGHVSNPLKFAFHPQLVHQLNDLLVKI